MRVGGDGRIFHAHKADQKPDIRSPLARVNRLVVKFNDRVSGHCEKISEFLKAHPTLEAMGKRAILDALQSNADKLTTLAKKLERQMDK